MLIITKKAFSLFLKTDDKLLQVFNLYTLIIKKGRNVSCRNIVFFLADIYLMV